MKTVVTLDQYEIEAFLAAAIACKWATPEGYKWSAQLDQWDKTAKVTCEKESEAKESETEVAE